MQPLEAAYLAGFLDGEGSFGIYRSGARMTCSNRHLETLVWIKEITGFGRVWEPRGNSQFNRSAPCYQWETGANGCRYILPLIIPYMRVNRIRAESLKEYLDGVIPSSTSMASAEEIARREILKQRINGRLILWGNAERK